MNEKSRNWKKALGAIADGFGQPLVAVLISLLLGAVVIMICGENVFTAYGAMIRGAFGNEFYINDTLKRATPIIMGGLAVCIAWRSGYEAMGGEGQMILGAFCSALVAYYLPLPGFVRLLLAAADPRKVLCAEADPAWQGDAGIIAGVLRLCFGRRPG